MIPGFGQTWLGKLCRHRSNLSWESSLTRVYTVCCSCCIFWMHCCMLIHPKFSDRQVWANSVDPNQCLPFCLHLLDTWLYNKTTVIKIYNNYNTFWVSEFFRFFQYLLSSGHRHIFLACTPHICGSYLYMVVQYTHHWEQSCTDSLLAATNGTLLGWETCNTLLSKPGNSLSVLFLMSDNEFSRIMYSLFRGRQNIFIKILQNIFIKIFSTKFVVTCAIKNLKIGWKKQKLCPKL